MNQLTNYPIKQLIVTNNRSLDNSCTGRAIQVDQFGDAFIQLDPSWQDPMIAFHIESKVMMIKKTERFVNCDLILQIVEPSAGADDARKDEDKKVDVVHGPELPEKKLEESSESEESSNVK